MSSVDTLAKPADDSKLDQLAIDTIRTLSIDAVQKADSGHPGTPLALAPVMYTLWRDVLRYDPDHAEWPNRDRFLLSIGHASMLLYATLHLAGVKELDAEHKPTGRPAISLEDIEQFRQLDSKTPGHPEYRMTTGVETTTGPLGQGCGNSVGVAMAGRILAQRFNKPGFPLFDYDVYALCGDGDMMEGVASEAASLAGHLGLSNLCWIYDSNQISIDGPTSLAFIEDTARRFEAYGWNVGHVQDANDTAAVKAALDAFKTVNDRPTFIVVRSRIGFASPLENSEKAHGAAMGEDNVRATKKALGWPEDKHFYVPDGVADRLHDALKARGGKARDAWEAMYARYRDAYPQETATLEQMLRYQLPDDAFADLPVFPADPKGIASRVASGKVLNALAPRIASLAGGAADLTGSTGVELKFPGGKEAFERNDYGGRELHFGVREHGMGSIANGMGETYLRPYTATFLVFSDYMKAAIRLAAIMDSPTIFLFTHDSISLGEDGTTHQPIEQLAGLRAIPRLDTLRPGDANEVAVAWKLALESKDAPTSIILSRQAIPTLDRTRYASADGVAKGAYILEDCGGEPQIVLMATGAELALATEAHETLKGEGVRSRLVSFPSWRRFELQDQAYRDSVLPPNLGARLAIEKASTFGWHRWIGEKGAMVGIDTFGASAPAKDLDEKFGFTPENVLKVARELLANG